MATAVCGYCKKICSHRNSPYLTCELCFKNVHLSCLKRGGVSSSLLGDVFFTLCCQECSSIGVEEITRDKLPWIAIVILSLYNLERSETIMADKYFHYKNDICYFIDKHYDTFRLPGFGTGRKTRRWYGSVSGTLSHYSPKYFISSAATTEVSGCWKLASNMPPKVLLDEYYKEIAEGKIRAQRNRNKCRKEMPEVSAESILKLEEPCKESTALDLQDNLGQQSTSSSGSDMFSQAYVKPNESLSTVLFDDDENSSAEELDIDIDGGEALDFRGDASGISIKEEVADILEDQEMEVSCVKQEEDEYIWETMEGDRFQEEENSDTEDSSCEEEFVHLYATKVETERSSNDSNSESESAQKIDNACGSVSAQDSVICHENGAVCEIEPGDLVDIDSVNDIDTLPQSGEENEPYMAPILLNKSLFTIRADMAEKRKPWEENVPRKVKKKANVHPMSEFEETRLLDRLQTAACSTVDMPRAARRLYRKLCVRRLRRQRGLPVFDVDGHEAELPPRRLHRLDTPGDVRVLDRFQRQQPTLLARRMNSELGDCPFIVRLMGQMEVTNFYSCYTQRLLKAYIYRDRVSNPPWLMLMDELLTKVNGIDRSWVKPERWPIDYSYVRPQHISSVNSLCAEYFYPGINLTDALSYPDFSCVALYKRLVIGFAFMVPDVSLTETYISFLFVRPEWRRAGIATFMVYHLIQTCMGKDVTLHVSATNPAVLLYQKFGFKVEEFVQDFYDKYLPVDSKECKHALFLRLSR